MAIKFMHKTSWFTIGFAFCSRHQIRKHVGSIDGPMWNDGFAGHTELLLSTLHVLVPNFNGHWCCLPLDLFASVSNSYAISDSLPLQNEFDWPLHSLVHLDQLCKAKLPTSSSIQTRISSCVSTIKRMYWHLCVFATKCFTVDCTCFISQPDQHVSQRQLWHEWRVFSFWILTLHISIPFGFLFSFWHFTFQSAHNHCFPGGSCQKWNLIATCIRCCSKYLHHWCERTRRDSPTWCRQKARIKWRTTEWSGVIRRIEQWTT